MWVALLAALLVLMSSVLVIAVILVWPAAAPSGLAAAPTNLGISAGIGLTRDAQLFAVVALSGALGGSIHALRSYSWYVGNRDLRWSWVPSYLLLPVIGAALATIVYLVLRAGLISPQGSTDSLSPFGFAAVGGLVGLFSEQASSKLKDVFESIFAKAPQGKDHTAPKAVQLTDFSPKLAKVGDLITILGEGFAEGVSVRFTGATAKPAKVTATSLQVAVPEDARSGPLGVEQGGQTAVFVDELTIG